MNVLIVGGGEVGAQISEALHRSHNVTVVDVNEEQQRTFETVDVQFMRGNGSDPEDLRRAGAAEADAFVACTGNDDVNILACLAAKGLGAKETMAFCDAAALPRRFCPARRDAVSWFEHRPDTVAAAHAGGADYRHHPGAQGARPAAFLPTGVLSCSSTNSSPKTPNTGRPLA